MPDEKPDDPDGDWFDYDHREEDDPDDREWDELEHALQECGQTGGGWENCLMAGTEHCDFDCPYRDVHLGALPDAPPQDKSAFIRHEGNDDVFNFACNGCGSQGELRIGKDHRGPFGCPEGCGATYIKWGEPPKLTCVVCPVFVKE